MHKALAKGDYTPQHNIATRNRDLAVPTVNYTLRSARRAVSFAGPVEWNNLPRDLRAIEGLKPFKKALKKYFLDQYGD